MLYKSLIIMVILAALSACGTTGSTQNDDNSNVDISEPAVDVSSAETQSQPKSTEVRLENLPVAPDSHNVELRDTAPQQYTVVPGDTLWDLSNRFLVQPWFWPEIWHLNPQINNPHLIYPGDVITVFYVGGKPYLTVGDGPRVSGVDRLSPKVRSEDIDTGSFGIPIQAIQQFIIRPRVVSEEFMDNAPYIVGSQDERLAYGSGDRIFARGFSDTSSEKYTVFRKGDPLVDPNTKEILGYEAILVGEANAVVLDEDPATFDLGQTNREALRGDRLLPTNFDDQDTEFVPHAPDEDTYGTVISLFDAITKVGTYEVITLNIGNQDGIEKGHVLSLLQGGRIVNDPFEKPGSLKKVKLPEQDIGLAMVFRTFEKVSYALVMSATRPIQVGDAVATP